MTPSEADRHCRARAHAHYENFPVASRLLPRRMRAPVAAIYVFARRADDLADEGDDPPTERLAALDSMEHALDRTLGGAPPDDPLWTALGDAVARFGLPDAPFRDLLSAFRQDVTRRRYERFDEVLAYCERSANPVGRLLLQLARAATPENLAAGDAVCTGLQLINFLQDLQQDFVERGRLYIPRQDLARHDVSEALLASGTADPRVHTLLAEQIERAAWWLQQGRDLPRRLPGRFGVEIGLILRGGWRIVERLRHEKPASPFARPRLRLGDRLWIAGGLVDRRPIPEPAARPRGTV